MTCKEDETNSGRTHCDPVNDAFVRLAIVLVQDESPACRCRTDTRSQGVIGGELVDVLREDIHVRDDLVHESAGARGDLGGRESERLTNSEQRMVEQHGGAHIHPAGGTVDR